MDDDISKFIKKAKNKFSENEVEEIRRILEKAVEKIIPQLRRLV